MDFEESPEQNKCYQNNNETVSQQNLSQKDFEDDVEKNDNYQFQQNKISSISYKINSENYIEFIPHQDQQLNINNNESNFNQIIDGIQSLSKSYEKQNNEFMKDISNQEKNQVASSEQSQKKYEKRLDSDKSTTMVSYLYQSNQLTIIKKQQQNLNNELFINELKILDLLKGSNITLDVISNDKKKLQFEQKLGKIDLHNLNKRIQDKDIFEYYFLVLLDKLNKMHKLCVAHSDIKPKNIVISFNDEPYFIDFDCSVQLKDFKDYLIRKTIFFNLDVFLKKIIKIKNLEYESKFENEEEVKLCDRTQLALTFLYLLCENEQQYGLFKKKKINELIIQLQNINSFQNKKYLSNTNYYASKKKNRQNVIYIISKILNEADNEIQIFGQYQQGFTVHNVSIYKELKKANSINYNKRNKDYQVTRIDKYSIKLLYLLDKASCKIEMYPQKMTIIPEPGVNEYDYIYQKYKQIEKYFENLLNGQPVIEYQDVINLCNYLKKLQNKICYFQIEKQDYLDLLFQSLQKSEFINTLQLNFIIQSKYLEMFLKTLSNQLPGYNSIVEFRLELDDSEKFSYKFNKKMIRCQIRRVSSKPELKNAKFYFYSMEMIEDRMNQFLNQFKKYYQINQIEIVQQYSLINIFSKQNLNYKGLQYLIKLMNTINLKLQINQETLCNQDNQQKLQQFLNVYNERNKNEIHQKRQHEDCIFFNVRKLEFELGENIVIQIFDNINVMEKSYKLVLKFYDFIFLNQNMWLKIIKIIQGEGNNFIQIEIINSSLSYDILSLLENIQQIRDLVKIEFQDEYPQQYQEDNKLIYNFYISNEENPNKIKLKILFYRKFGILNKLDDKILREIKSNKSQKNKQKQNNQIDVQNRDINNFKQAESNYIYNQNYINSQKDQNELNKEQNNNQKIQNNQEQIKKIKKEEDLKQVIEKVKNNIYFRELNININGHQFKLSKGVKIIVQYQWNMNQIKILDQFFILLYLVFKKFKQFRSLNFSIIDTQQQFKIEFDFQYVIRSKKQNKKYIGNAISHSNLDNTHFLDNNHDCIDLDNNTSVFNELKSIFQKQQSRKIELNFKLIIFKEMLIYLISDISEDILDNKLLKLYESFEKQYNLIKQQMEKMLEITDYLLNFIIKNEKIDDQQFIALYKGIQKRFNQKQKKYELFKCSLKQQTLLNIYETLSILQDEKIEFDLTGNDISLSDLEMFIQKIQSDQPQNTFEFYIKNCNLTIQKILRIQFNNFLKFKFEGDGADFVLSYSPINQQQKLTEIQMNFKFLEKQEYDFLNNKINQQISDSVKQSISLKEFLQQIQNQFYPIQRNLKTKWIHLVDEEQKQLENYNFPQFNKAEQSKLVNNNAEKDKTNKKNNKNYTEIDNKDELFSKQNSQQTENKENQFLQKQLAEINDQNESYSLKNQKQLIKPYSYCSCSNLQEHIHDSNKNFNLVSYDAITKQLNKF